MEKQCEHEWGTDGAHANIFCKKCFISQIEEKKYCLTEEQINKYYCPRSERILREAISAEHQSTIDDLKAKGWKSPAEINSLVEELKDKWETLVKCQVPYSSQADAVQQARAETAREIRLLILQAIIDEPEFPEEMPDEIWQALNGDKNMTSVAMRNAVKLTKNGIVDRFTERLKEGGLYYLPDSKAEYLKPEVVK